MRITGKLAIAALLVYVPLFGVDSPPVDAKTKVPAVVDHSLDAKTIRAQEDEYVKNFTAQDAAAIADMWTKDGTYTAPDGQETRGRTALQRLYASYFKTAGPQKLRVMVKSITFPADNVAVEEGTSQVMKDSEPLSTSKYQAVHLKENGQWRALSVSETELELPRANRLGELGWMRGQWSATDGAHTAHFEAKWDKCHNFLIFQRQSEVLNEGGEIEVIGTNPNSHRLVSWHFDSSGGYGNGWWSRDGNSWIQDTVGVQSDGRHNHARYIINKIDDNKFTWQSTNRTIGSTTLPDTIVVTVNRDITSTPPASKP